MNIFFVDKDPVVAAQSLCNRHVIKMILEGAQMLSTAQHLLGYGWLNTEQDFYRKTHVNHPCNIWIRQSYKNYDWLLQHTIGLLEEYTFRYNKEHASKKIVQAACNIPDPFNKTAETDILTFPALAMPDEYKTNDAVESYRNYYIKDKLQNIDCRWTKREPPNWIKEHLSENKYSNTNM